MSIERGTVNDTAGDLALGVHLRSSSASTVQGIFGLTTQRRLSGATLALDAAGMGNGDGVLDDMYLILQRRVVA